MGDLHSQPQSTRGRRQSGEIAWPDRSGVGKANVVGRSRNSASRSCSTGQFKGKGGRMQWWPGNVEAAIPYISPTIPTPPTHHIPSTPHRSRFYVATFLAQCVRVPLAGKRSNKELQANLLFRVTAFVRRAYPRRRPRTLQEQAYWSFDLTRLQFNKSHRAHIAQRV